jgi:hypothetical protein
MIDIREFPIDWERLAFPQEDGYDTEVLERIAEARYGWRAEIPSGPTWLGDRCEIRPMKYTQHNAIDVEVEDDRWYYAEQLCRTWPAQHRQLRRLVNQVSACVHDVAGGRCGTHCGPRREGGNPFFKHETIAGEDWGNIWAAMDSGSGFCEGMSHELGHWKGYALGVFIEDWEPTIFANQVPTREHIDNAPGRYDLEDEERRRVWNHRGIGFQPFNQRLRPIGAMFQEIWICVHMIAFHLAMWPTIEAELVENEADPETFLEWARFHVARTQRGHADLLNMAELVPGSGEAFWQGYCSWTDQLMTDARHAFGGKV